MKQYLALKASAGSGKTFALTVRYISLLLLGAFPKEILTLTFTNKAAAQMAERIYNTLISLGEDIDILNAVSKETSLTHDQILEKKDQMVKKFITDELSIYTIDKFINKILREFSGYIGINDDFDIKFDDEELLLYKFLISLDTIRFFTLVSFAHTENKKLNSIVELFKTLNEKNEKLETVEYTYESYEAVKVSIMEQADIIKNFIEKSDLSKSAYNAVDFTDIDTLLEKGKTWLTKESLSEFTYFKKAKPPAELDDNLAILKEHITLYFQIQESFTLKNLFEIFDHFKTFRDNYNKNRNSLEFSDITNIVYTLMEKHIDKEFLYFRLDSRYNHILIDEFQDTSTLQYKILYHLIDEIISGNPEVFKTFFYVGDVKQSIYRFRGGTKELFDHVTRQFSPMLEVELLDMNYRSSQSVVHFVNDIFVPLKNYDYDPQKVKSDKEGFVEVVSTPVEPELIYQEIYLKIDYLLKEGISPSNIAILTYTNNDVLSIYEYLKQKMPNLDIVTEMTSKLINQTNVKAIINAVKYIYFKEDIYRLNFNTLRGSDYFEDFSFKIDIRSTDITTLIKKLSFYYDIVDSNVVKLIEISLSYNSIVDFVIDIDKEDTPMVALTQSGLQILTVFKSKGLEFDTVLVCDRITKKSSDRSSLLFEYDDIELQKIYYKRSNRQNIDRFYEEALNKEKKLVVADELNILYVALTRAKNNMIVLKKEKNSVFDYLGDFPKTIRGKLYIEIKQKTINEYKPAVQYQPLSLGYQEKTISNEDEIDNIKAKYFGLCTHYCLEMMNRFEKNSLEKAIVSAKNKYGNLLNNKEFEEIYGRVEMLISNSGFQDLVSDAVYAKEQSLIFEGEHKIIDLLVQKDDKFIIIDYKTTIQKSSSHNKQVENYVNALKDILSNKNIIGYVVYLQKNNIEIVKV